MAAIARAAWSRHRSRRVISRAAAIQANV